MMKFSMILTSALNLSIMSLIAPCSSTHALDLDSLPQITDIHTLMLYDGVNIVPNYLPNGEDAVIFQAWRNNGNAHSYTDWLVSERCPEGSQHTTNVISLREPASSLPRDIIYDDPFDNQHSLKAVRFARGMVNGKATSLLLIALRNINEHDSLDSPVPVTIDIYQPVSTGNEVGHTPFEFSLISSTLSTHLYCNAMLAMSQLLSIPLPLDYEGNISDDCH